MRGSSQGGALTEHALRRRGQHRSPLLKRRRVLCGPVRLQLLQLLLLLQLLQQGPLLRRWRRRRASENRSGRLDLIAHAQAVWLSLAATQRGAGAVELMPCGMTYAVRQRA